MALKNLEVSELIDIYGGILTEKQRLLVEYYYNDDLSLSEIAQNEGITRQGVRDTIKRAEHQLYEIEEKLGICEKSKINSNRVDEICKLAEKISEYNLRYNGSKEIDSFTKEIIELAKEI